MAIPRSCILDVPRGEGFCQYTVQVMKNEEREWVLREELVTIRILFQTGVSASSGEPCRRGVHHPGGSHFPDALPKKTSRFFTKMARLKNKAMGEK
jgi:hypothetical protein